MADIDVEPVERVEDDAEADESSDETPEDGGSAGVPVDTETRTDETNLPSGVDAPEYVLYGGKGGVGKTTMAAATALASAADGTATLVVSTDPAHSLSDTLGTDVPAEPARVREDMPLYAAEIDPDAAMEGPFAGADDAGGFDPESDENPFESADEANPFEESGGGEGNPFGDDSGQNPFGMDMGGMEQLLGPDGPMGMSPGSMPGADEAAAMQQLLAYLDDPRFDRVVVDTAPTGHTLRLLELPEVMDSMLGRIARMKQQFSGMMDQIKGLFGGGTGQSGAGDLDELRERIERLRRVLRDPSKTDFRVVMIPEEMSVVESKRLVERLDGYEIPVQTLVVNRVMENLADVTDASVDPKWVVTPDLEHCEFCQRRWQVQQNALQTATDLFRGRDVKRVPLLAEEVQGEDALRVVAACLA
ncbi:ArsA family ATPase [Halopelagius longus]|uniref:Arsenic-transporting ATPase n=1 Tax=Halopelagius longus TaxID=1236180 RepID=A0A1H1DAY3_9EURY|nr:TRC40/GET3/ArsA family transport-energizing ATPase [Halopelagius longus]RDI71254.1 arsenic-transporting ATPase [Halopelagius longus]SDQ73613.1 arsenite efflux ATP-binding protein ArsA [Halopelagius longus]